MKTALAPAEQKQSAATTQLVRLSGMSLAVGGLITTSTWVLHGIADPGRGGYAEP
jgi:hypothetical protein